MTIEVLYFEGCPNHRPTVDRVREILERLGLEEEVVEVEIRGLEDARHLKFLGSPSVRVDGVDIEPAARTRTAGSLKSRSRIRRKSTISLSHWNMRLLSRPTANKHLHQAGFERSDSRDQTNN